MDYDGLMDIVKQRRTTRVYRPDPIPEEFIDHVIEAARWAPTGANTQPFEFLVVRDTKTKKKLNRIFAESSMLIKEAPAASALKRRGAYLEVAPVLIIVLGDPRFQEAYPRGTFREEIFQASLSTAVQNMHLAATALGLGGSVWVTVSPLASMKIKECLRIPQIFTIKTIMPLGYAKAKPAPPAKRDPVVHEGGYDMDKFKSEEEINNLIRETATLKGKLGARWLF